MKITLLLIIILFAILSSFKIYDEDSTIFNEEDIPLEIISMDRNDYFLIINNTKFNLNNNLKNEFLSNYKYKVTSLLIIDSNNVIKSLNELEFLGYYKNGTQGYKTTYNCLEPSNIFDTENPPTEDINCGELKRYVLKLIKKGLIGKKVKGLPLKYKDTLGINKYLIKANLTPDL